MDTKAIEKFSIEAREQLLKDVEQRLYAYGLDDAGRSEFGAEADAVRGMVLTATEKRQRAELFRRIEQEGTLPFITEMAYTWFNRFAAIRYMELHDFLPSHVRMLSAADGSFEPECLKAATTLDLPGLDRMEVAQLIQAADDEALYRTILIAQCNELASFLPKVFGTVAADALTLPANLLRKNEFNVLHRLVTDIPEDEWQDVEILGWMYQFYNSEVKAEFFKSKRKAAAEDIAPATQLFTPEWIVRYMVDNSLGRLWMLNHPESHLRDRSHAENSSDRLMEYYIEPDEEHEDFIRVTNPEDITFCDPACGSGHILVYAFKLLMAIYEECGYREREIPELILTKNLIGFEIDPRAAQIATLALALCAREHDRRFFDRGITADVTVLQNIEIDTDSLLLTSPLRNKPELLENLAHLGEIGSLFLPSAEDIAALEADLADAAGDNLFTSQASSEVERALTTCRALARRFDVVVANPPYMGSSSFNPFMSKWVKKHYPDSCKDLCTAFIERILGMLKPDGYSGITGTNSWMFLSSFETLRDKLIDDRTIVSLVQLSVHGFKGVAAQVCTGIISQSHTPGAKGAYIRLNDYDHHSLQEPKTLEAIQNPDCGWFYRADATTFHDIPGSPIAYWASPSLGMSYSNGNLSAHFRSAGRLKTHDNNRYLRTWWESSGNLLFNRWRPLANGGGFSRWSGMKYDVVDYSAAAIAHYSEHGGMPNPECLSIEGICWGIITSDMVSFRIKQSEELFSSGSPTIIPTKHGSDILLFCLAFLNSSVTSYILGITNPTLNTPVGNILLLPACATNSRIKAEVHRLASECISLSEENWDSQETSWDFKRNPLV